MFFDCFYLSASSVKIDDLDSMYQCKRDYDCTVDDADCNSCGCDNLIGANKDYSGKICEGVLAENSCNEVCQSSRVSCVNHVCAIENLSQ